MFRLCPEEEYEELAEGGTRYLYTLDHFGCQDTLDGDGFIHYFVVEQTDGDPMVYETDLESMYEFMARYLAGEYEKTHYEMKRSPTHAALMDVLEVAAARARSGDPDFSFEQLERSEDEDAADPFGD